jgi:hypothetical protein
LSEIFYVADGALEKMVKKKKEEEEEERKKV